ncbi:XRE family transcriptional regulator [Cryobacterium lactosi]|uniref:XRE family transcriptional regulator n=1 Tax=Cryobacterium lactosi TaxID=1259202 RepID=A0A4R9BHW8_9MICO|nr:helix-turn-helix transcriptional regulator [Cryobacterium lactosi]TFD85008.1 XRE family transcriptional regulator [Cryobacterium lactosi]
MSAVHSLGMLRERAGLSIERTAVLVGCEAQYLARVESMEKVPTLGFVERVAVVLADALKGAKTWKVANRSGWVVDPGTLTMAFLANADNPTDQRERFIITAATMAPANAWDRCSGGAAGQIIRDDTTAGEASDE